MDLELKCMEIISNVGMARSNYILAVKEAKDGKFDTARNLITEGETFFAEGHHTHVELFSSDLPKDFSNAHFLLMHAEDQLMSAESFKIVAKEFIELYERLNGKI